MSRRPFRRFRRFSAWEGTGHRLNLMPVRAKQEFGIDALFQIRRYRGRSWRRSSPCRAQMLRVRRWQRGWVR